MQMERLQDGSGGTTKTRVFKNFIDGEWVESVSGNTFEDRNPADTREVVAIFQCSNKAAVDAAKRAFAEWWLVPAPRGNGIPRRRPCNDSLCRRNQRKSTLAKHFAR
jgi:hypothetical protein